MVMLDKNDQEFMSKPRFHTSFSLLQIAMSHSTPSPLKGGQMYLQGGVKKNSNGDSEMFFWVCTSFNRHNVVW
jgi:hypothetical protein